MWANATNTIKRQRLERLDRLNNYSIEWETIFLNFFKKKTRLQRIVHTTQTTKAHIFFEQINVAFVQTNDIYILAAAFTYY